VQFTVVRENKTTTVDVTMGTRPQPTLKCPEIVESYLFASKLAFQVASNILFF
jgi:hypothetical protein